MANKFTTSLNGFNALVCGSTSGIGLSTAQEFAISGASVTLFARNEEKLQNTLSLLKNIDDQNHQYIVGDFNYPDNINKIVTAHIASGNKYHILINNSGGPKGGPIVEAETSEFIDGFNRHLICNHMLAQALLPGMKNLNYGRIINIISTSVKEPITGLGVSNTIRGAVASWAKTLSIEVAKDGITVNNILPGFTKTDRLSSLIKANARSKGKSEDTVILDMKNQVPSGRFGFPEETAKAIAFLSSTAAGYINGVSLAIDGGRLSSI